MTEVQIYHIYAFYILMIFFGIYLIRRKITDKDFVFDLLLIGIFGWSIAFFINSIPFQFLADFTLYKFGINIRHIETLFETSTNWLILVGTSIFIGIFEEVTRYQIFRLYQSIDKFMSEHRIKTSLFLGIGWATADVVIGTGFAVINGASFEINLFNLLIGIYTRLLAYVFHICMSFIVFFAVYDKTLKSKSLWLAIGFNILVSFFYIFWTFAFETLAVNHPRIYLISQQIVLTIALIGIVYFTFKNWIPKKEPMLENVTVI